LSLLLTDVPVGPVIIIAFTNLDAHSNLDEAVLTGLPSAVIAV